jgi:hypothetical protein
MEADIPTPQPFNLQFGTALLVLTGILDEFSTFVKYTILKISHSCDEQPLLRIPERASSLHARGLSQQVLHRRSLERLSNRS